MPTDLKLRVKRVYDPPLSSDGVRILVDRLWPRGLKKETARLDEWLKEVAPSDSLRRWFAHEPARWEEFKRRYFAELDAAPDAWSGLLERARREPVTLLYAARDPEHNNAVALALYLEESRRRFLDLDQIHQELEDLLLRHQEALMTSRVAEAGELLDRFEEGLRLHIRHEEEWLLPIYEARRERESGSKGAGATVYSLEHKKMLEWIAKIRKRLHHLAASEPLAPRAILALLEREWAFKHLLEHHNERERTVLYPQLDRLTSPQERRQLTRPRPPQDCASS